MAWPYNLTYERAMWRALAKCARDGHLIVGLGRRAEDNGPHYCWTCFYNYPYTEWISWSQWLRNFIGGFIR